MKINNTNPIYYLICSTPRTGSTLLCTLLENTCICGKNNWELLKEISPINKNQNSFTSFLLWLFDSTKSKNSVSGFKIQWSHLEDIYYYYRFNKNKDLTIYDLYKYFPSRIRYIWIRRRNKLKQAISLSRLFQSGVAIKIKDSSYKEESHYDAGLIALSLDILEREDKEWEIFFHYNNVKPLIIFYEDLIANLKLTLIDVINFIGVDKPDNINTETLLIKQSDCNTDKWIELYESESKFKKTFFRFYKKLLFFFYIKLIRINSKNKFIKKIQNIICILLNFKKP